ncbi:MAG: hypothetical protein KDB03_25330 [Planctomycetales bacterium]|nr:hypothetical protein [Planctomycetales bacterium]
MFLKKQILFVCLALLLQGCGGDQGDRRPTARTTVTVNYKGAPVEGATVQFVTVDDPKPSTGITDKSGQCSLSTYEANDGAIIGSNLIMISKTAVDERNVRPVRPEDADMVGVIPPPILKNLIPAKYALPATSGLQEEVKKGQNTFTFDLQD